MIEATELMIGDLVMVRHLNRTGKIYRIDCANGPTNAHVAIFYGDFSLNEIEPIPLTPEILEKNGFMPDAAEEPYKYSYQIDGVSIAECHAYASGLYRGIFSFGDTRLRISLRFVHQLQNALHICGIEHDIKL